MASQSGKCIPPLLIRHHFTQHILPTSFHNASWLIWQIGLVAGVLVVLGVHFFDKIGWEQRSVLPRYPGGFVTFKIMDKVMGIRVSSQEELAGYFPA